MPDDHYTHGHQDAVLRSHRSRTVGNSASYLASRLAPGLRLLDVGCGPGTITADLAALVDPGLVTALDRSTDVVAEAATFCAERGVLNIEFEVGDVYALDHADDTFDVVHAHQVLQHLSDPVGALVEMRRVTKPEGVVAVRDADYSAMVWHPADQRLDRWMEVYQAVARANHAEPDAGRRLKAWARAAGFSDVQASADTWLYEAADERAWWGGLWADRITSTAIGRQAVEIGAATEAELHDIAAGFRDWAAAEDGWFLVPHGEVLAWQ